MKGVGAIMVILSCSVFGLSMADALRARAEFLRSLARALTILRNELCTSMLTVGDVLKMLAENQSDPAHCFFAECSSRFGNESLKNAWAGTALGGKAWGLEEDECRALAGLGEIIGRYEAEKQRELIDRVIVYFEDRAKLAEEEKRRQYKLRAALGLGSGLMLAILML